MDDAYHTNMPTTEAHEYIAILVLKLVYDCIHNDICCDITKGLLEILSLILFMSTLSLTLQAVCLLVL